MDACPLTRLGLMRIVKSSFNPAEITECDDSASIAPLMFGRRVDYVLMDVCGKNESVLQGLNHIQRIKKNWPLARLIVCTSFQNPNMLKRLVKMRVAAICSKSELPLVLKKCIRFAQSKECYTSPVIETLLKAARVNGLPWLTPKEMEVMDELFDGHTVTDISTRLYRDVRTVSTHKQRAMEKFGFRNDYHMYIEGNWLYPNSVCYQ